MKHLINREDYIKEYLRISNYIENVEKVDNNENELYEGLLGTLFGGLKMLLKKDWDNIKCKNSSVLKHLQEIDKSLGGYTMTKMQFSGECQTIRQNVADYFNDILDYKLSQLEKVDDPNKFIEKEDKEKEENKDAKGVEKSLNLKDKTVLDSINKYKENISTACKASPKLREYADQMLNSIDVFVNRLVIAELEEKGLEKEKAEELEKKNEEKQKKLNKVRNKMNNEAKKAGEEALKKISEDRDDLIISLGVKPIGAMDGDKAIESIVKEFSDIMNEIRNNAKKEISSQTDIIDILKGDTYLGIKKIVEDSNLWDFSKKDTPEEKYKIFYMLSSLNKIYNVFNFVKQKKEMFKGVPSGSVHAMMISLSNVIIYAFSKDKFDITKDTSRIELLAKCAIDSDATIGFNLPLIDTKKPEYGNFFVSIMYKFRDNGIKIDDFKEVIELMTLKDLRIMAEDMADNKYVKQIDGAKNLLEKMYPDVQKSFKQNILNLFDEVLSEAKKLKKEAQKKIEAAAKESEAAEQSE